jgi:hypothetical protein
MYAVRWRSLYTDATGVIGPMKKVLAEAIVLRNNSLFPDIHHWIEVLEEGRGTARLESERTVGA